MKKTCKRDRDILKARKFGHTFAHIGCLYGMTRQRAFQIVKEQQKLELSRKKYRLGHRIFEQL